MYRIIFLLLLAFFFNNAFGQMVDTSRRDLTTEELKLYDLIMEYRDSKRLASIPISPSLCYVALLHARDLNENPPKGRCNMHSWSKNGPWGKCCYTEDHAKSQCMWDKPRELTSYPGYGYEIAFWSTDIENMAEQALKGWKESSHHNNVMINKPPWRDHPWKAIGLAIVGNYAIVWFGEEEDL
ncbi:MAG: CAP domain-containing protein [Marinilabiliales bacterium]|mgnify:CR=1 FL=1|nr:MAG: CAP domain-containing protein [Marinilabiliales bacterium]